MSKKDLRSANVNLAILDDFKVCLEELEARERAEKAREKNLDSLEANPNKNVESTIIEVDDQTQEIP